jgi:hypothetical protein
MWSSGEYAAMAMPIIGCIHENEELLWFQMPSSFAHRVLFLFY